MGCGCVGSRVGEGVAGFSHLALLTMPGRGLQVCSTEHALRGQHLRRGLRPRVHQPGAAAVGPCGRAAVKRLGALLSKHSCGSSCAQASEGLWARWPAGRVSWRQASRDGLDPSRVCGCGDACAYSQWRGVLQHARLPEAWVSILGFNRLGWTGVSGYKTHAQVATEGRPRPGAMLPSDPLGMRLGSMLRCAGQGALGAPALAPVPPWRATARHDSNAVPQSPEVLLYVSTRTKG